MTIIRNLPLAPPTVQRSRSSATPVRFGRGVNASIYELEKQRREEFHRRKKWAEVGGHISEVEILQAIRNLERRQHLYNICIPLSIIGLLVTPLIGYPVRIATESEVFRQMNLPREARESLKRQLGLLKRLGFIRMSPMSSSGNALFRTVHSLAVTPRGKRYLTQSLEESGKKKIKNAFRSQVSPAKTSAEAGPLK